MLTIYPACFFKEENGYSVIFPDLENGYLATCVENLDDAISMAIDCLAGYVYVSKELNEDVPKASKLSDIDIKKICKENFNHSILVK